MESIIKTENLSKSFKRGSNTLFAVKNVNFTLCEEGELLIVQIIDRKLVTVTDVVLATFVSI